MTALDILKFKIPADQFNTIMETANMAPYKLSNYATELINSLDQALLSVRTLRETLYDVGCRKEFDLIAHDDASFIETTTRYL